MMPNNLKRKSEFPAPSPSPKMARLTVNQFTIPNLGVTSVEMTVGSPVRDRSVSPTVEMTENSPVRDRSVSPTVEMTENSPVRDRSVSLTVEMTENSPVRDRSPLVNMSADQGTQTTEAKGIERPAAPEQSKVTPVNKLADDGTTFKQGAMKQAAEGVEPSRSQEQSIQQGSRTELFSGKGVITNEAAELLTPKDGERERTVLAIKYSGTGGGHTKRLFEPVLAALNDGTLKPGDTVVVLMPPRWAQDKKGGKVKEAHDYVGPEGKFNKSGLNVVMVQTDKMVTGLYLPDGTSDAVGMWKSAVLTPYRDNERVPSSMNPKATDVPGPKDKDGKDTKGAIEYVRGYTAKESLDAVIKVTGVKNVIVFTDMAPDLQKAAFKQNVVRRVEQSNHAELMTDEHRKHISPNLNLAQLSKSLSDGRFTQLAPIRYDDNINVLQDMNDSTLKKLNISNETTMVQARTKVIDVLLKDANRIDSDGKHRGTSATAGIIVSDTIKNTGDVKGIVYLYANDYTEGLVKHINEKIAKEKNEGINGNYSSTLFAVCGGAFSDDGKGKGKSPDGSVKDEPRNILHLAYAANASGLTNAGFGTTSEYNYLAMSGDYKGDFVVAPVKLQHEQMANANILEAKFNELPEFNGRVTKAADPEAKNLDFLYKELDALVVKSNKELPADATMQKFIDAVNKEESNSSLTAALLNRGAKPTEKSLSIANAVDKVMNEEAPDQVRRMDKLLLPILMGLEDGKGAGESIDVLSKRGDGTGLRQQITIGDAIKLLKDSDSKESKIKLRDLLGVDLTNAKVIEYFKEYGEKLQEIAAKSNAADRAGMAKDQIYKTATEERFLGW